MNFKGKIDVIFGPMFSGKSTELQRKMKRYLIAEKKCLIINYAKDNRYSNENVVSTHDKQTMKASKFNKLSDADDIVESYEIIGIDEGQFFDDLVEKAEEWANMGKVVIIAALDATFQRKPFNRVCELVAIAENVKKLHSVCNICKKKGSFTQRVSGDSQIELVGGVDIYKSVCRKCYYADEITKQLPNIVSTSNLTDISEETPVSP